MGSDRVEVVSEVTVRDCYTLEVLFDDGVRTIVNLEPLLYGDVFEPLKDPALFAQASVDPVLGTVVWPNGADLSPEFLRNPEAPTAKENTP